MLASMSGACPAVLYGGDAEIRADSGQHELYCLVGVHNWEAVALALQWQFDITLLIMQAVAYHEQLYIT